MISNDLVAPFLGFPFLSMLCGYIIRYNVIGSIFPWAPLSILALSDVLAGYFSQALIWDFGFAFNLAK